jgi:hypothetical protein
MKRQTAPRVDPPLGSLPDAKVESRYRNIQALVECGGTVSLGCGDRDRWDAAFGRKGCWAAIRAGGGLVDPSLRRIDWAIAIGNQMGVRVDEMTGTGAALSVDEPRIENRPMLRFPRIQSLLDGGGTICFGNCKPGAAVATNSSGEIIAVLAHQNEEVLALIRRLEWSIGVAKSQGKCLDEVFHGPVDLPTEITGEASSSSKRAALGSAEKSERPGAHKGKIERAFSLLQVPHCVDDGSDLDLARYNIHIITKADHDLTKTMKGEARRKKESKHSDGSSAPMRFKWVMVYGKRQLRKI